MVISGSVVAIGMMVIGLAYIVNVIFNEVI